jgi:hypothetical protein
MTVRGPELEFGVAGCPKPREIVVVARIEVDPGKCLRVAPVEPLGKADHRGQRPHGAAERTGKLAVAFVRLLGRRLPVIAGDERDHLDFLWIEAAQVAVLN